MSTKYQKLPKNPKISILSDFQAEVNRQIEKTRDLLCTKWYDTLRTIYSTATRRKIVPEPSKPKAMCRFFDCVASQMTQCLQDIAIRSLKQFKKFMQFKSSPRIRLHILLEDEDRLVFSPTFVKIQNEILHIIDSIQNAVQHFDRLEYTLTQALSISNLRSKQLKPIIPENIVSDCRNDIVDVLEEERIVPELLLQDFDEYMSLMNGNDIDQIYNFMSGQPSFDEYCTLVNHYNDIEYDISINIACIISVGFYEFHRSSLIDTLEALAKFMQTELLARMVSDQQSKMSRLQNGYEEISKQALETPKNTAELMASIEYVKRIQADVIPDMEKQLKLVKIIGNFFFRSNNFFFSSNNIFNFFPLKIPIELGSFSLANRPNHLRSIRNQAKQYNIPMVFENAIDCPATRPYRR